MAGNRSRRRNAKSSPKSRTKSRNRSRTSSVSSKESSDSTRVAPSSDSTMQSKSSGQQKSKAAGDQVTKVTILGAGGGIGQPLAMLLMLHNEMVQHVAMHDLVDSIHGVGLDVSHIDRRCKITTHLGQEELAEAVQGAKVIIIPAGLAQKPGMSRDDLFASNAKILYNLLKVCVQVAPNAMLAIITNPVNSLVPIACELYIHHLSGGANPKGPQDQHQKQAAEGTTADGSNAGAPAGCIVTDPSNVSNKSEGVSAPKSSQSHGATKPKFHDCCRRIFGVTTLDVVRASTLTAKSTLFKSEPNGMFRDPITLKVPVVGGHAGKTIMPLLSQATPKFDRKRLLTEDKTTVLTLVESIQQAGIEVLNAKKGKGSATMAMAYSACRFALSLLRAIAGEQSVVECAYVHQPTPIFADLDYFATPLLLGKEGFVKSLGIPGMVGKSSPAKGANQQVEKEQEGTLLPYEQEMLEEGARMLRLSIARGEDFVREQLSAER